MIPQSNAFSKYVIDKLIVKCYHKLQIFCLYDKLAYKSLSAIVAKVENEMKKVIAVIFVNLFVISVFCGCDIDFLLPPEENDKAEYCSDRAVTTVNDSFWGNYCNYSWACETDNYIYVGLDRNYRIDKETGKAEYICTDKSCHHTRNCLSSGVMSYMQSSGERVFGLLETTADNFADTPNFVELKPRGLCDNVYKPFLKKWDYAVYAVINDTIYVFEKNKDITYLKAIEINKQTELSSVEVHFDADDNDKYLCRFISGGKMYCTNTHNELKTIDMQTGEVTTVLKDISSPQPSGESIYFLKSQGGKTDLYKSDMSGGKITEIFAGCKEYNIYKNRIYFTNYTSPKKLCSMNLSGKEVKTVHKSRREIKNITILPKSERLLFSDDGDDQAIGRQIYRCGFDGKNVEKLAVPDAEQLKVPKVKSINIMARQ